MSVKVETLEKNMAKLVIEVPAEELEKALQAAYNKTRKILVSQDSVKVKYHVRW